jgi:hypothetical protein
MSHNFDQPSNLSAKAASAAEQAAAGEARASVVLRVACRVASAAFAACVLLAQLAALQNASAPLV